MIAPDVELRSNPVALRTRRGTPRTPSPINEPRPHPPAQYNASMISISIKNQQELVELDIAALKSAAKTVLEGEGVPSAKITFAFFDDATIHAMNKRHLNHDEPTDVLTFPYSIRGAAKLEGDVAIGAGVGRAAAEERGHSVNHELCLYVIHACLHLCGYNDKRDGDIAEMRAKERHYLAALDLPDIAGE